MSTDALQLSLTKIKILHTIIWICMFSAVIYVFYSGTTGKITLLSWLGVALICLEGVALLIGKGDCPLHIYALQTTGATKLNDTYLPEWLFFRGYKWILTGFFLVGLVGMVVKSVVGGK